MKGFRFYQEFETEKRKVSKGTIVAMMFDFYWLDPRSWEIIHECGSALYDKPNSICCGSQVSRAYLASKCRRVSEARAREIHPKLFEYLEG